MSNDRVIYIVDDDPALRRSLERLLYAADFQSVSFATPSAFLSAAAGLPGRCVLLDLCMPEMNGLEVQERLNQMKLELPVIVMTGQGDVQSAVRAMRSGATDFLEKPFSDDALIGAIEAAPKVSAEQNRSAERAAAAALIETLSPREQQVLEALVAGHPNKAIAFDLDISVRTVELHRARMMARLGVRHFAEAIRLAVLANLAGDR